jgi:hypothetical protein
MEDAVSIRFDPRFHKFAGTDKERVYKLTKVSKEECLLSIGCPFAVSDTRLGDSESETFVSSAELFVSSFVLNLLPPDLV